MRKLSILVTSLLFLTGCTATTASSPTPTETQTQEPEPVFVAAPLTGVLYEEGTNPSLQLPAVMAPPYTPISLAVKLAATEVPAAA